MNAKRVRLTPMQCKAIADMILGEPFLNLVKVAMAERDIELIDMANDRLQFARSSSPESGFQVTADSHPKLAAEFQTFLDVAARFRGIALSEDKMFCIADFSAGDR